MHARLDGGLLLRRELGQFAVEPGILLSGGLCEKMPFHRFDHILWQAAPGRQNARGAVLRDGIVARRRLEKELRCRRFILRDADAVEKHDRVFDLRRNVVVPRRAANPLRGLRVALFNAGAFPVQ